MPFQFKTYSRMFFFILAIKEAWMSCVIFKYKSQIILKEMDPTVPHKATTKSPQ